MCENSKSYGNKVIKNVFLVETSILTLIYIYSHLSSCVKIAVGAPEIINSVIFFCTIRRNFFVYLNKQKHKYLLPYGNTHINVLVEFQTLSFAPKKLYL